MAGQIAPLSVPLTDGVIRSFGHVRLSIAGLDFTGGFLSISRSRKRDREMVYSNNPDPVGKTLGQNKYECKATVLYDWAMNLIQTIQSELGPGYGDIPFTIFISYVGQNLTTYTDQILGCTFDDFNADDKNDTKALEREIDFHPTKILFGGYEDLADPLVAAA